MKYLNIIINTSFLLWFQGNQSEANDQILNDTKNSTSVSNNSKEITIPDIYEVVQQVRINVKHLIVGYLFLHSINYYE